MYQNNEKNSNCFFVIKAMAIFMVICAHCPYDITGSLSTFLNNLGVMGVPIFFLLSGYFYHIKKYSFAKMIKKKLFGIIIPWFICGFIVYFYIVFRKGGFNFLSMIEYVLGYGSYLYYLSILMMFFIIFYFVKDRKWLLLSFCLLFLINTVIQTILQNVYTYPYLNPLNWIGWFSVGVYAQSYINVPKTLERIEKIRCFWISLGLFVFLATIIFDYRFTYWTIDFVVFEAIMIIATIALSTTKIFRNSLFVDIGKKSFSIYLLHMPIVGLTNLFCVHWIVYIVRPFFVLFMIYMLIYLYNIIANKKNMTWMKILIGLR